jgi:hypothetical protein
MAMADAETEFDFEQHRRAAVTTYLEQKDFYEDLALGPANENVDRSAHLDARLDDVVPVAVELLSFDLQLAHLLV